MKKLYIVAGEKSGDIHGSLLLKNLLNQVPELEVHGLGGRGMHELCPQVEDWADEAAVIGFVEVAKKYGFFRKKFLELLGKIQQDQPDCLVLVDYPGFNLRLAEKVHATCPKTKIAYFISPQVWAWHRGRIPKMARILDLMMCIFPFEAPLFEEAGLPTKFVGHPLVDEINALRVDGVREENLIGLFPGSRNREIDRHFPVFIEVVKQLRETNPELRFETAASTQALADRMCEMAESAGMGIDVFNIRLGQYHQLMDRASVGVVASGTATMEAALHRLPYMLIYRVPMLTYWMAKMLIKIRFIGMVNILADKSVVKELIQHEFTPETVIAEIKRLLIPAERDALLAEMQKSVDKLGPGGAAQRAAEAVAELLLQAE
ncbi:MAG: lipid-A-disaccharide synthase [Akkermansia sp.]|nr:lipid-A-disaccharide synthase [Akkermansia sp.]